MSHRRFIGMSAVAVAVLCAPAVAIGIASTASAATTPALSTTVAPGGNFDLSHWEIQLPIGSPGSPTTITAPQLEGPKGFTDKYFFTNTTDGSMSFWDPENGVTTPNSNFSRSELREMNADGSQAAWLAPGTHTLSATLKVTQVPDHVAVGQIHLGQNSGSTKPLLELFYFKNGNVDMAIEQTPAGGNEVHHVVGNVKLGTKFSYVIGLNATTISMTLNGTTKTFALPSSFKGFTMYFKAGDYDQTSGSSSTVGAKVQFYALTIKHSS